MKETWKDIRDFEGTYQVSNLGRVRSLDRKVTYVDGRVFTYKGKILRQTKDTRGYPQVGFNLNGKKSTHRIHRLVAETFLRVCSENEEVNHIDGIKSNNKLSNLEWVTSSENTRKGYELGLFEKSRESFLKRLKGNKIAAKKVSVFNKSSGVWIDFESARDASRKFSRAENYFTQLLRIGGENKFFKVKFLGDADDRKAV